MTPQNITIPIGAATVTIPARDAVLAWLEREIKPQPTAETILTVSIDPGTPPRICASWPAYGGIYAGIGRGDEGQPDYHLIVLEQHDGDLPWKEALDWAAEFDGREGSSAGLPKRKEQAVLFGNVPELFDKAWYWSCEQYAGDDESAWSQYFGYGSQSYSHKTTQLRARAVRRVPIR